MMYVLWLLAILSALSTAQDDKFKLPSYVNVCYRDDPKVADCLTKEIERIIPKLNKAGSKDFDLNPLDPMVFENLIFDYKSPVVGGHLVLPSFSTVGLIKLKVTSMEPKLSNPKKFLLDFSGHIPLIKMKSAYNLTGNFISAPLSVKGVIDFVLEEVDLAYHIDADVKTINGNDFLDLNEFTFRMKGEGIKAAYLANDNVIDGKPTLNRAVAAALKTNWRILKDNLLPAMFPVTDSHMRDLFKDFFRKYPYDVLFPRRKPRSADESESTESESNRTLS